MVNVSIGDLFSLLVWEVHHSGADVGKITIFLDKRGTYQCYSCYREGFGPANVVFLPNLSKKRAAVSAKVIVFYDFEGKALVLV